MKNMKLQNITKKLDKIKENRNPKNQRKQKQRQINNIYEQYIF